jgi:hypothetical protein
MEYGNPRKTLEAMGFDACFSLPENNDKEYASGS